jgi:uracil-DNA glycosylase
MGGVPLETFPFGMPIKKVVQKDRSRKRIFVLGVYASAVHARWIGNDGQTLIKAVAVASEPEIFWRGEGADAIINGISLPQDAGRLLAADRRLNGPSGRALDDKFLAPLGLDRSECWLCDLVPFSRQNHKQKEALSRSYDKCAADLQLPSYNWPDVPCELVSADRLSAIQQEVLEASPDVLITLGDEPLRWFTKHFNSEATLASYGDGAGNYGRLHDVLIEGRKIRLLPLVHPRHAARLGLHSPKWATLHDHWVDKVAGSLLDARP